MAAETTITVGTVTLRVPKLSSGDPNVDRLVQNLAINVAGQVATMLNDALGGVLAAGSIGLVELAPSIQKQLPALGQAVTGPILLGVVGTVTDYGASNSKVDVTGGTYMAADGVVHTFAAATALATATGKFIIVDTADDIIKSVDSENGIPLAQLTIVAGDITVIADLRTYLVLFKGAQVQSNDLATGSVIEAKIGTGAVTPDKLAADAQLSALIGAGLGVSDTYTKTANGVGVLLASDPDARVVLGIVRVTEAFAGSGEDFQTTFKIGEVGSDAKFLADTVLVDASLGDLFLFAGVLTGTKNLIVTANDATGVTGTGAIAVDVLTLPAAA
jgi:hypothetical protein